MKISNIPLSSSTVFVIAEVGSNHQGELSKAKEHIDAAAQVGAQAVKFQSLNSKKLYINPSSEIKVLHKMIDMEEEWHQELKTYADKKNIIFCSSPTYLDSVDILRSIDVDFIKLASAQVATFPQLIHAVAATGKPALFSTGLASYKDLNDAVNIFEFHNNSNYGIFHCNSQYPTPPENVYLGRIDTYKKMFNCPVGYSDHTEGTSVVLAAVAKGADMIEKHFKIDSCSSSPDAAFSIKPDEFQTMISEIYKVKAACCDKPRFFIEPSENKFKDSIKYKLIVAKDKTKSQSFHNSDFNYLRSDEGIDVSYEDLILSNFVASNDLKSNQILKWSDVRGN